jgi:hypothetical protein
VEHVEKRGWYGLKRAAVDAALGHNISQTGLQAHGGWSDPQMPLKIYAEHDKTCEREDAKEAVVLV